MYDMKYDTESDVFLPIIIHNKNSQGFFSLAIFMIAMM